MRKPSRPGRSLDDVLGPPAGFGEAPAPPAALDGRRAFSEAPDSNEKADDGGKAVTFFVTPTDRKRMRQLMVDVEMPLHDICREALDLWLEARGLPPLQPQAANRQSPGRKRT